MLHEPRHMLSAFGRESACFEVVVQAFERVLTNTTHRLDVIRPDAHGLTKLDTIALALTRGRGP